MLQNEYGLSNQEAEKILEEGGANILPEQPPPGELSVFISQLKNPLVGVLLAAGLITLFLRHFSDALIIFLAVFINTILGFVQERKASRALRALKKLVTQETEVVREGKRKKIDSRELVPGDVVVLHQGAKIPADGELLYVNRLYLDEGIITGESVAVSKQKGADVYMGTTVFSGQGLMRVKATGAKSIIGEIAKKIQEVKEITPLGKQLAAFSKRIVLLVLGLVVFVFVMGVIRGNMVTEMFTTSVALAVSSIPEGLLVSLTVVLAIGMQRILKRSGLVRKLSSAETLGGVTTICVDKTGTLTEGRMQVVEIVGNQEELAQQVVLANDLDDPLVIAAFEWGRKIVGDLMAGHEQFDSIPFSSEERFFLGLHKWTKETNMLFVNGAPEILLQGVKIDKNEKQKIEEKINVLTSKGRRLIGFARKEVAGKKKILSVDDARNDLVWVGMLALSDPVRPSVKESLQLAKEAGLKIVVLTGDYANTSEFVLSELGIPVSKNEIVIGTDLEKFSPEELSLRVKKIKLFARVTPEQKLKIVEALKNNKEIVAVMGDGVNDAPAIHKADIGIAVSEASDVARESADLVLLDSNFATIIAAIEEGRSMFENIRKIILYLLSDAFAEIVLIAGSIILGLPLPITAVQIIWINLVSDGFPNLALTVEPKRIGIMREKPRFANEPLVNRAMLSLIGLVSLTAGLIALSVFFITYKLSGDIVLARSMSFITLGLNSLTYVFSLRSLMVPFWKNNLFENRWLIIAVIGGFGLQLVPFLNQSLRTFFGVTNLEIFHWGIAIMLSISVFFIMELFKLVYKLVNGRKNFANANE